MNSPGGAPAAALTGRQVEWGAHAAAHLHAGLLAADSAVAPRSTCTQTRVTASPEDRPQTSRSLTAPAAAAGVRALRSLQVQVRLETGRVKRWNRTLRPTYRFTVRRVEGGAAGPGLLGDELTVDPRAAELGALVVGGHVGVVDLRHSQRSHLHLHHHHGGLQNRSHLHRVGRLVLQRDDAALLHALPAAAVAAGVVLEALQGGGAACW